MCNNLEVAYNNHRLYRQSQQQFSDWLKETKQHIKAVQDVRGSKDNVHNRLSNLDVSTRKHCKFSVQFNSIQFNSNQICNDYQTKQVSQQQYRNLRVAFNSTLEVFISTTAVGER
jgi:hypothetical protein